MGPDQLQMQTPAKRAHRNHDYVNLFGENVYPTGEVDVLERGGNLLIIKSYEYHAKMKQAQRKIYKLLTRYAGPDAPGNITVVCVWGLGNTPREYIVFDHQGEHPARSVTVEQWRLFLRGWWDGARRHR